MSANFVHRKPPVEQLDELAGALEQFLWRDECAFYHNPPTHERRRLPGFVRVVEALRPLRDFKETEVWPNWLADFVSQGTETGTRLVL
jgi:hypothetical protein